MIERTRDANARSSLERQNHSKEIVYYMTRRSVLGSRTKSSINPQKVICDNFLNYMSVKRFICRECIIFKFFLSTHTTQYPS